MVVQETARSTGKGASKESSAGANVSVCIPPFCVGPYVMGSVSGGGAHGSGNFASVSERSGIQAGDGGFDVKVQGNTKLVGGVIASTDAAVDGQKNSFQSGSLTTSDIVNNDSFRASGASLALGYGSGSSAGIGKAGEGRTSVTESGISGVAGNKEVRTGNGSNGLTQNWRANELLTDAKAQVEVTSAFSQQASGAWGRYANGKFADAVASGDEEAAACWAPSGSCRATGHAAIGGLTGGLGGAVGAGVSSVTAPVFIDFLRQNEVPEVVVQVLAAGVAVAAGGAMGGPGGAAGAYNETTNNAVVAVPFILEALVTAGEAAVLACARSPKCVGLIGATVLNALTSNSASNQDGSGSTGSGAAGGNQADTYGTPPNGASPPPDNDEKNPTNDRKLNADGEMLGKEGTSTPSTTVYNRAGARVDVENPNPGQRPGQIHLQIGGDKITLIRILPNSRRPAPHRMLYLGQFPVFCKIPECSEPLTMDCVILAKGQ